MCGIAGFSSPAPCAPSVIRAMVDALAHRGPDGAGVHIDSGMALGHRRLAVIDLLGGAQPRVDPESGDALVFNGEIYGYQRLAAELRGQGIPLLDHSDTEVLFRLIQSVGICQTLEKIDGMFAFAYREGKSGDLYLARDRFGEKPLFYGMESGQLVFASEISSIRRHPAFQSSGIDRLSAVQFLSYEYLPGDTSGWTGIKKLPPGHFATFRNGGLEIESYWQPRIEMKTACRDRRAAERHLLDILDNSVRDRVIADVPVGVFLSGGVDSSVVAALAARHLSNLTAFTIRFPEETFDETPYATRVASVLGLRHEVIDLDSADLIDAFNAMSDRLDEPIADSSFLPTFLVCRAARMKATVAIGGDGADELFCGYPNFQAQRATPVMACFPRALGRGLRQALSLLPVSTRYMNLPFRLAQLSHGFGWDSDVQSFLWMAPFALDQSRSLWQRDALPEMMEEAVLAPIRAIAQQEMPDHRIDRLNHMMIRTYLSDDILVKMDRASMMNSLEVRSPFLSREVAEFAMSLPRQWKLQNGHGKIILKSLAAELIPPEVAHRKKHGFALPLAKLLRTTLREPVAECLLDTRNPIASWFEKPVVAKLLSDHASGKRDNAKKLWALYVLFRVAARRALAQLSHDGAKRVRDGFQPVTIVLGLSRRQTGGLTRWGISCQEGLARGLFWRGRWPFNHAVVRLESLSGLLPWRKASGR